ncbi:MAG: DHA2 family efflux MFS transporter permease subunit [Polyangiaceae bacterium]|nr:DHA2 family efflux MFS transporter permease subunit [Polyangiaceae bacterium]
MGAIDASIVNVALSQIRGAVGATVQEITWISTGFAIATVMVMPLTGFFGRLFGQKKVYLACLALFVVGSTLCGFAWNLPSLVVFRAIQGFGAGALQPTEQAILRQTFPPKEQAMAMALFAMAVMIGPALGPTLGGFIVDNFHWSWIFFINVPVGILGFFLVTRFVQEDEDLKQKARVEAEQQRRHMDWLGIALLWVSLISLQYVLEEGQADDWFDSPVIVVVTLVSVFSMVAFVVRELTAVAPAVNLRLFRDRAFAFGTLASGGMFAVLMSGMFLLPLFMQELLGFSATQSGLALMPRTLVMLACMPIVARVYRYTSPAVLGTLGILVNAYGQYTLSGLTLDSSSGHITFALVLQGVGMSMMMVPLQTVALSTIPRERMADATGLSSLVRQIGGSFGVAAFATILARSSVGASAALRAHLVVERPEVQARLLGAEASMLARGMDPTTAHGAASRAFAGTVARQGTVLAFDHLFVLGAVCFALVIPLILMLRRPAQSAGAPVHVEME